MSTRMASLVGKGRNELMDINGCGFDEGRAKAGGKEKPMEKMKRQRK